MEGWQHRFGEAGLFNKSYRGLATRLQRQEITPIARAFEDNCERVFLLAATQVDLVFYSLYVGTRDREVRQRYGIPFAHPNPAEFPEYLEGMNQVWDELAEEARTNSDYWKQMWAAGSVHIERHEAFGTINPEGLAAILSSMIISGWMCFESLSVDLWKLMVNSFPTPLAKRVLAGQPPPDSEGSQRDQRSLSIRVLEQHSFDLSKSMGDVLARSRKVNLDSFVGVVAAYETAFGADFDRTILDVEELKRLEAYRNLYAHRGGVVDQTFINRCRGVETLLPLEVEQKFYVSGTDVAIFMDNVVASASNLLLFADKWFDEQSGGSGSQRKLGLGGSGEDLSDV